jgi:hypothetical protein
MNSFSLDAFDAKSNSALSVNSSLKTLDANASKREPIFDWIDSFFLFCEENKSVADDGKMWKTEEDEEGKEAEDYIMEQAEKITLVYEIIADYDGIKSKIRKHVLKCVDAFNSKNEEVYGKLYFDEYLEFMIGTDYDELRNE